MPAFWAFVSMICMVFLGISYSPIFLEIFFFHFSSTAQFYFNVTLWLLVTVQGSKITLFLCLFPASAAHVIVYEAIGRKQFSTFQTSWGFASFATVKIRELRVLFHMHAVLANVQFNHVPLAFRWLLINVFSTRATFDVAKEIGVRQNLMAPVT